MDLSAFKLFLRPTGKFLASRYGAGGSQLISPREIEGRRVSNPDIIVAIPTDEAKRYHREYRRQIREGALESVTAKDFAAYLEAHKKRKADAAKERAKAEAEAEAAEAPKASKKPKPKTGGES